MDPILINTTMTTKFLVPLVIKDNYTYEDLQTNLIAAYIADVNDEDYNQCIIVVLNEDNRPECLMYNYIERDTVYDNENKCYNYRFIYKIEDNLLEEYFNFIKGEYSNFSEHIKRKILGFWKAGSDTLLYSILFKDKINIEKMLLKRTSIKENPQQFIYDKFIHKYNMGYELYKMPNLKKEMYGYDIEL
jgi:hypothetical protein